MQGYEPWFTSDAALREISEESYRLPLHQIANCSWLGEHLRRQGANVDSIVHPGVDLDIFFPRKLGRSEPETQESSSRIIRLVSYCDPRPLKGWLDSVRAMKTLLNELPAGVAAEWHVFGHGDLGDCPVPVTHHGFLTHQQLADLYRSADILFVPSWLESFPLQPLEAMACGAAVVTTRIGTEDYAIDGETALVVEAKQPAQMSTALARLVHDSALRDRLSTNGLKMAQRFSWESSVEQLFAALFGANRYSEIAK